MNWGFGVRGWAIRSQCFFIFVLALGVRITYIFMTRSYLTSEGSELTQVAANLAEHKFFGDPFKISTGATAHVAPAYPFLLSTIYRALGRGTSGELAQEIATSVVSSLQFSLIPFVSLTCNLPPAVGLLAGFAGALLPFKLWIETKGTWEASYTATILVVASLVTLKQWGERDLSVRAATIQGLVWGTALLISPALLSVLAGLFFVGFYLFRAKYFKPTAITAIAIGVVLLPWTIRNYYRLGALIFVRDNFGLELSVSNNDTASPTLQDNLQLGPEQPHPFVNSREALQVREIGELAYNRLKLQTATSWIMSHRSKFGRLTAQRFRYFWFPRTNHLAKSILTGAITVLSAIGWIRTRKRYRVAALVFGSIWVTYSMTYYLIEADPRYPYPIYFTLLIMASAALLRHTRQGAAEPSDICYNMLQ